MNANKEKKMFLYYYISIMKKLTKTVLLKMFWNKRSENDTPTMTHKD